MSDVVTQLTSLSIQSAASKYATTHITVAWGIALILATRCKRSFRDVTSRKALSISREITFLSTREFRTDLHAERGGTKRIASLQLQAANIASVVSQNFTRFNSASFALQTAMTK
jgi:hypothetical protein